MKIDKILLIMMAGAMMASCASDNEAVGNEGQMPVNLNYITVQANETRAANDLNNTKLTSGKVKVNMKKHSDATWNTAVDYTVESDGSLTGGSDKFFYYNDGSTVDIIAYYPSTAGESFSVETDQSEDADYQKSDLMWATPIVNQSRTPATLTLQLNHQMAKISVKPIKAAGITKITSIKLKQVKPTVSFNQTTGAVGDADGTATEITVASNTTDGLTADGSVYYAAVIPAQTIDGGFLEIEADGQTATYAVNSKAFLSGHAYTLDITVNPSALGATNTIIDWNAEAAIVGGANLANPLVIDDIDDEYTFTGSAIEPAPTVKFNGNTLTSGYNVYYTDNLYPGTATLVVSYDGMYVAKTFTINNAPLGALFFEDGTIGLTNPDSKTIIGIVVYWNEGRENDDAITEKDAGYGHGLVMALNNTISDYQWSIVQVNQPDPPFPDVKSISAFKGDFKGIAKTNVLKDDTNYPAFYNATRYSPAPTVTTNNSGWFLASGGQWLAVLGPDGLGSDSSINSLTWEGNSNNSQVCLVNINNVLTASDINGTGFSLTDYLGYATSSEQSYDYATACFFNYLTPGLRVGSIVKNNSNTRVVRPFLAF